MDCNGFQRNLGAWLDGKADEQTREVLGMHTTCCRDCRLLLSTRQQLRSLVIQANWGDSLPRFVTTILEQHARERKRD